MTEPTTFPDAYEMPQLHAQELRNSDETNLDELLTAVKESCAAYKVREQRIAAEATLKEALGNVSVEVSLASATAGPAEEVTSPSDRRAGVHARQSTPPAPVGDADIDLRF